MAVSAKFEADFTQFDSAVKSADANLRVLEGDAAKIGPVMKAVGADAGATFGQMSTALKSLAAGFGIVFSVQAVVGFGKELLRMGDELVRVADRTGLTTTEVQRLSYVAGQSGNTIDELTGAIGQMQNRLASGDKSAVQAVKELGIHFETLVKASPADQLGMIATAIAKIPDPATRTAIAMDLFGKTGTAILPTLTSQFEALAAAAPIMSDATVKALDTAGDALGTFGLGIKVFAAEAIVKLLEAGKAFEKFAFWAAGMHAPVEKFNFDAALLSEKQDHLSDTIHKTTAQLQAEAQALKDADAAAKTLNDEAYGPLSAATKAQSKALADQYDRWKEDEAAAWALGKAAVTAQEDGAAATKKHNDELAKMKLLADAAAAASRAIGGSSDVTSQNFAQQLTDLVTTGGWNPSGIGSNIDVPRAYRYAHEGYSFAEIISIFAREKSGATGPVPPPQGPRIPGFAEGGPTMGGLSMLHSGEYVVPKGGALVSGSGGSTVMNFYVNGTGQDVARIVMDELTRTMKQGRKWPSN